MLIPIRNMSRRIDKTCVGDVRADPAPSDFINSAGHPTRREDNLTTWHGVKNNFIEYRETKKGEQLPLFSRDCKMFN